MMTTVTLPVYNRTEDPVGFVCVLSHTSVNEILGSNVTVAVNRTIYIHLFRVF